MINFKQYFLLIIYYKCLKFVNFIIFHVITNVFLASPHEAIWRLRAHLVPKLKVGGWEEKKNFLDFYIFMAKFKVLSI